MTLVQIYTEVSRRLNEQTPTFYPVGEIIAAINEGQRLFCLLTLVLETTQPWTAAANTTFAHLLPVFTDLIVPLRIADIAGAKIRPARLADLSSLDSLWPHAPGAPKRYSRIGADLVALYPQPTAATQLQVTYAHAPVTLAADSDVPQIPSNYHSDLIGYAINRVRQVEGAAQLAQTMPLFAAFLDGAQTCGNFVRSRNRGQQYDVQPFELQAFDRSQLLKLRKDLVPMRPALVE